MQPATNDPSHHGHSHDLITIIEHGHQRLEYRCKISKRNNLSITMVTDLTTGEIITDINTLPDLDTVLTAARLHYWTNSNPQVFQCQVTSAK